MVTLEAEDIDTKLAAIAPEVFKVWGVRWLPSFFKKIICRLILKLRKVEVVYDISTGKTLVRKKL